MDDDARELEQIRNARRKEMEEQSGGGGGGGGPGGQAQGQAEQRKQQQAEQRQHALNQILHPEAQDRLGRIRLVNESRATDMENRLIMAAQTGQLRQKVTDAQLKGMLEAVSESQHGSQQDGIKDQRRRRIYDDDDEDDDFFDDDDDLRGGKKASGKAAAADDDDDFFD